MAKKEEENMALVWLLAQSQGEQFSFSSLLIGLSIISYAFNKVAVFMVWLTPKLN